MPHTEAVLDSRDVRVPLLPWNSHSVELCGLHMGETEYGVGEQGGDSAHVQAPEAFGVMPDQPEVVGELADGGFDPIAQDGKGATNGRRELAAVGRLGVRRTGLPPAWYSATQRLLEKPRSSNRPITSALSTATSATARSLTLAGTRPSGRGGCPDPCAGPGGSHRTTRGGRHPS